ncbi:DUF2177 family protein [Novosphingobium sp. TH158]|uniref:DUF2177 family protein n=1 Tax=Novosphingobium sp. TH158 TaxID=2067455 RepID=UPI000C7A39FC|nr:DUF2177 family protein [Novosphingobium sp. TH158]PLK25993.1 DUF2177 domain-containing protein [Novosphingobium sp. TH158]
MKWTIAYISAAISFGILDFLWLGWAGKNFYRPAIGELLAPSFRGGPALVFYAIYIAGMVWFAVRPGLAGGLNAALLNGVLLGGLAYATYDLTNQATMKVWPVHITIVDIIWGAFATAVASVVATWVTTRFTA